MFGFFISQPCFAYSHRIFQLWNLVVEKVTNASSRTRAKKILADKSWKSPTWVTSLSAFWKNRIMRPSARGDGVVFTIGAGWLRGVYVSICCCSRVINVLDLIAMALQVFVDQVICSECLWEASQLSDWRCDFVARWLCSPGRRCGRRRSQLGPPWSLG